MPIGSEKRTYREQTTLPRERGGSGQSLAIARAAVSGGAVASGLALARPGAAFAICAVCLRIVLPVCHRAKDQPADGYAPGKMINGGPAIEGGQCLAGKTNLHCCAKRLNSLGHSYLLWLGLGPVARWLLSPACYFATTLPIK
jgi:hypothetical protein